MRFSFSLRRLLLVTAMVALIFGLARGIGFFLLGAIGIAITLLIAIPLGSLVLLTKSNDLPRILGMTAGAFVSLYIASESRLPVGESDLTMMIILIIQISPVALGAMIGGFLGGALARWNERNANRTRRSPQATSQLLEPSDSAAENEEESG